MEALNCVRGLVNEILEKVSVENGESLAGTTIPGNIDDENEKDPGTKEENEFSQSDGLVDVVVAGENDFEVNETNGAGLETVEELDKEDEDSDVSGLNECPRDGETEEELDKEDEDSDVSGLNECPRDGETEEELDKEDEDSDVSGLNECPRDGETEEEFYIEVEEIIYETEDVVVEIVTEVEETSERLLEEDGVVSDGEKYGVLFQSDTKRSTAVLDEAFCHTEENTLVIANGFPDHEESLSGIEAGEGGGSSITGIPDAEQKTAPTEEVLIESLKSPVLKRKGETREMSSGSDTEHDIEIEAIAETDAPEVVDSEENGETFGEGSEPKICEVLEVVKNGGDCLVADEEKADIAEPKVDDKQNEALLETAENQSEVDEVERSAIEDNVDEVKDASLDAVVQLEADLGAGDIADNVTPQVEPRKNGQDPGTQTPVGSVCEALVDSVVNSESAERSQLEHIFRKENGDASATVISIGDLPEKTGHGHVDDGFSGEDGKRELGSRDDDARKSVVVENLEDSSY